MSHMPAACKNLHLVLMDAPPVDVVEKGPEVIIVRMIKSIPAAAHLQMDGILPALLNSLHSSSCSMCSLQHASTLCCFAHG